MSTREHQIEQLTAQVRDELNIEGTAALPDVERELKELLACVDQLPARKDALIAMYAGYIVKRVQRHQVW